MDNFISTESNMLPESNFKYITNEADALDAMMFIDRYPIHALDTETTALDPYEAKWSLLQVGVPGHSFVFDVRYDTEHSSLHPKVLSPLLQDTTKIRILQNAAYDMKIIKKNLGYYLTNIYDTMLAEQLLNLGLFTKANLQALVLRYLGLNMPKEPRLTFKDYYQKFNNTQLEYAAHDVVPLHMIRDLQIDRLKSEKLVDVLQLESDFIVPLCEMELNGISIDKQRWRDMMSTIEKERDHLKIVVQDFLRTTDTQQTMFGVSTINVDSQKQLKAALSKYGLSLENTSEGELSKYKGVPVIDAILDYRKANKLISTYSESLLAKISKYTNRLHTDFRQMVSTGRMSSSNPNLQNIPKKQRFRSCFVAEEGYTLLTADMKSAELRILGNLSNDPVFLDCFRNDIDLHTRSASEIFGVSMEEVDRKMRGSCKALSFGLCVDENTNLFTTNGMIEIKDATIGTTVAHGVGCDKIIDKKFVGQKEVFEIETIYGYTLTATEDHVIKVIDENGNYIDRCISAIDKRKDKVCLKMGADVFSETNFVFDKFDIEKRTNCKDFMLPKIVNDRWASFLGLFVAEGHLHKNKAGDYNSVQFGISKNDEEFVSYIDELLTSLFTKYTRTVRKSVVSYSINTVKVARWLSSIFSFDSNNKTDTIDVPKCIKLSTKSVQIAFLSALFEGDGTIWRKKKSFFIKYDSKSITLIKTLQTMLLNFCILSSIYYKFDKRYPNNIYYSLNIIGTESRLRFISKIGFITDRKNNKGYYSKIKKRSSFTITYPMNKLKSLQKMISKKRREFVDGRLDTCNWYLYNNLNIGNSFHIGNRYFDILKDYDPLIKFIDTNNIVTLDIKDIKKVGNRNVYDISVNNEELFLANGFIVHNCYGMSSFGLSKRLGIPEKQSQGLIDNYFKVFKSVKRYLDKSASDGVANGYSESIAGHRRYYNKPDYDHPDKNSILRGIKRQAMNMPVQSSNAATIKKAMVYIVQRLKDMDLPAKLILTVHDEVVVEVKNGYEKEVSDVVENSIKDGFGYYFSKIPMESDVLEGPCWLKDSCGNKINDKVCGCKKMVFVKDSEGSKHLICSDCGALQE